MKRYTTYTRKYKDQADCKNFGKQFDSMFDSMDEMFSMFNSSTVTENKTIIKKDGKTYVIDKDGKVTVNGKQMVEMCDKPYDPYNCTAADCKVEQVHENAPKFDWHMFWGFVLSCSLAILISCLICK